MKLKKCLAVFLSVATVFSCAFTSMAEVAVVEEVAAENTDFELVDTAEIASIELTGVEAPVVEVEEVVETDSESEEATASVSLLGASGILSDPWQIGSPNASDVTAYFSDGTLTISGTGDMMDLSNEAWNSWEFSGTITSVVIGSGVTSIGTEAFRECTSLTSIEIPEGMTSIGAFALDGCTSLMSAELPSTITSIGQYAFGGDTCWGGSLKIKAATPPAVLSLFNSIAHAPTIYVPYASLTTYKDAGGWPTYKDSIVGYLDINYKDQGDTAFSGDEDGLPKMHVYGEDTTLESASKDDYVFGGWYKESDCSGEEVKTLGKEEYTDTITLFAKWEKAYTVEGYEDEYGMVAPGESQYAENDTVTLTVTPAEGYQLVAGSLKVIKNSDTEEVVVSDNKFTMPADNVTVVAEFEAMTYTITADINNPAFGTVSPESVKVKYGTSVRIEADDYTFVFSDGQTMTATPNKGYTYDSLTVVEDYSCIQSSSAVIVEFRPIENKVTFDSKGGTEISYQMVFTGEKVSKPEDPVREGYVFLDWTVGEAGIPWDFDKDTVAEAMTFTALWGVKSTFDVSEGIKGIYIQFEGDDEPVYFTAEECLEPAMVPAGMKLILTKVDCKDGYECTMSLPYTYIMPDHDDTFTITAKKKSNPTPVHDSSDNDNTPLFTGTWSNAVTNGSWSQDSNGIWHYTSTEKFKATWGYIINPYAGEGQNKADWFWFDIHGNMLTGWQFINGKWYYLNPTKDGTLGACLIGPAKTPDGYEVDASGAWTGR